MRPKRRSGSACGKREQRGDLSEGTRANGSATTVSRRWSGLREVLARESLADAGATLRAA